MARVILAVHLAAIGASVASMLAAIAAAVHAKRARKIVEERARLDRIRAQIARASGRSRTDVPE